WELRNFRAPRSEGGGPVVLLDSDSAALVSFATPFADLGGGDLSEVPFRVADRGPHRAAFVWTQNGFTIHKLFELAEDTYELRLRLEVENHSTESISPGFGVVLPERVRESSDFQNLTLQVLRQGNLERTPVAQFGRSSPIGAIFGRRPQLDLAF